MSRPKDHSYLRSFILVIGGILFTGFIIIIIFPAGLVAPFGRVEHSLERFWAATLVKMAGIRLKVSGLEGILRDRTYIFVANHQGLFDIPVLMYCLPKQIRMIHKKELLWIPMFGQILQVLRFIPIDRGKREQALISLKKAARKIHDGVNIAIFADGTRSLDGELRPFKNGAFVLAIDAQVEVVPVTISGTINVLHKKQSLFDITFRREVRVILGKPIPTHGLVHEDKDRLRQQVESVIRADYAGVKDLSVITDPELLKFNRARQDERQSTGTEAR